MLLVDDDALAARATARILRLSGYDVIHAGSCCAVCCLGAAFDVAVLELDLNDGQGDTLAGLLLAEGCAERVVFLTSSSDASRLEEAARVGAVVAKSAPVAELLAKVAGSPRLVSRVPPSQVAAPAEKKKSTESA